MGIWRSRKLVGRSGSNDSGDHLQQTLYDDGFGEIAGHGWAADGPITGAWWMVDGGLGDNAHARGSVVFDVVLPSAWSTLVSTRNN